MSDSAVPNLRKRLLSLIIDFLIIAGYALVLLGVDMFIYFVLLGGVPVFDELGMNLISLALIVPSALYCIIAECSKGHATIGKRAVRIKVASVRPAGLRVWQVVVRNIVKFLPWQFAHMAIFHGMALGWEIDTFTTVLLIVADVLPFIWIGSLFGKKHRGIHDRIAGTIVVHS